MKDITFIILHCILQPRHIFIGVKAFNLMFVPGRVPPELNGYTINETESFGNRRFNTVQRNGTLIS